MRGKLRLAMICGIAIIFGASAVAVGKKAKKEAKKEAKVEKAKVAKEAKVAPDAGDKALGAPTKVDVKCNIPPIKVNVSTTAPPPAAKGKSARGKSAKGAMFNWAKIGRDLVLTLIFSLLGLAVAMFGYFVYHWIVPFDLVKELEVDQNTSLGIVLGSIILGLCIIVAAAIASPS
jgi:putative membrane protein